MEKLYIVALDETGKAYPKEIHINYYNIGGIDEYLENKYIEYYDWSYGYHHMAHLSKLVNKGLLGKVMKCKQCGKYYILAQSTIEWYDENGLDTPKRCKACRMKNRKKRYIKMLVGGLR